jgi:hypothetical protein
MNMTYSTSIPLSHELAYWIDDRNKQIIDQVVGAKRKWGPSSKIDIVKDWIEPRNKYIPDLHP